MGQNDNLNYTLKTFIFNQVFYWSNLNFLAHSGVAQNLEKNKKYLQIFFVPLWAKIFENLSKNLCFKKSY
jgi:hypothetical protein